VVDIDHHSVIVDIIKEPPASGDAVQLVLFHHGEPTFAMCSVGTEVIWSLEIGEQAREDWNSKGRFESLYFLSNSMFAISEKTGLVNSWPDKREGSEM
jgi:hypothetical protein